MVPVMKGTRTKTLLIPIITEISLLHWLSLSFFERLIYYNGRIAVKRILIWA